MSQFEQMAGLLRCPTTGEAVRYTTDPALISRFDSGKNIREGFINLSETRFYPVIEGIICMLPDASESLDEAVKSVKAFYEEYGWKRSADGRFHDSVRFLEKKSAVESYYVNTTKRLGSFLKPAGKYLLDVASGPVFQPENQAFSENFEKRICVDISLRALAEARANIGDEKGIFINGDITRLPLADGICDNVMSIHTLYHVPEELQSAAVKELVRVCRPGSDIIIIYNWAWHSWPMNVLLLPVRVVKAFKRLYRWFTVAKQERWHSGGLYFYPHSPGWFVDLAGKLGVGISFSALTSIHQDFVKYYVHDGFGGAALLRFIERLEEKFPHWLGRNGAFGFIILKKPGKE